MFPDCEIVKKLAFAQTKWGYVVNHGLSPYFHELVFDKLNQQPGFNSFIWWKFNEAIPTCWFFLHIKVYP